MAPRYALLLNLSNRAFKLRKLKKLSDEISVAGHPSWLSCKAGQRCGFSSLFMVLPKHQQCDSIILKKRSSDDFRIRGIELNQTLADWWFQYPIRSGKSFTWVLT
jgi:hypothetical protein